MGDAGETGSEATEASRGGSDLPTDGLAARSRLGSGGDSAAGWFPSGRQRTARGRAAPSDGGGGSEGKGGDDNGVEET